MSKLKRGRILIIIDQRGQNKQRKPKCMKSLETAIGRIKDGSKRRDTQTKRVLWSFYKKQSKNEKMQKSEILLSRKSDHRKKNRTDHFF